MLFRSLYIVSHLLLKRLDPSGKRRLVRKGFVGWLGGLQVGLAGFVPFFGVISVSATALSAGWVDYRWGWGLWAPVPGCVCSLCRQKLCRLGGWRAAVGF